MGELLFDRFFMEILRLKKNMFHQGLHEQLEMGIEMFTDGDSLGFFVNCR